jgi:hypothetical protein
VVVGQNVRPGGPQILVHFDINHPFLPIAMFTCIYIYVERERGREREREFIGEISIHFPIYNYLPSIEGW